ncbi:hypothetical protein GBA52_019699, partial [Prunus armeniaca]
IKTKTKTRVIFSTALPAPLPANITTYLSRKPIPDLHLANLDLPPSSRTTASRSGSLLLGPLRKGETQKEGETYI